MSEWISVEKELPNADMDCLVYAVNERFGKPGIRIATWITMLETWAISGFWQPNDITHWMPLPKPPRKLKYADNDAAQDGLMPAT